MLRTRLTALYPLHLDMEGDPSGPGTASVVAAPAPSERRNDSSPGLRGDSDDGAVARTLRDLKAAVTRGEVGMVPQTPAVPARPPAPTPPAAGEPPAGDPAVTPPAGETPPVATPDPSPVGDPAPLDLEPAPEPEAALEADDPLLTIELPARRQGQEAIPIRVEDRETAEALRHMRNLASRTETAEAQAREVQQQRAELDAFEELLTLDPIGVIVDQMRPELQVKAAEQLLALPGVLEQVLERIERWQSSAEARDADAARFENSRIKTQQTVRTAQAQKAQQREIVNNLHTHVGLLAELVDPQLSRQFRDDALGDLAAMYRARQLSGHVAPEQFAQVLATRLRLYGIAPDKALQALTTDARAPHPSSKPRPKGPAAEALAARSAAQGRQANGEQFVRASRVRQQAAAAAPAPGASITVPTTEVPNDPKYAGVMGRIRWLKERAGIPVKA